MGNFTQSTPKRNRLFESRKYLWMKRKRELEVIGTREEVGRMKKKHNKYVWKP